jgi:hypothetical protein
MKLENLLNKPHELADGRPGPSGRQGIEKMKVNTCLMACLRCNQAAVCFEQQSGRYLLVGKIGVMRWRFFPVPMCERAPTSCVSSVEANT